jgi:hypothetical protein
LNDRSSFFVVDTFVKRCRIESEIGGIFFQIGFGERADVFALPLAKELVVIFPELALPVRALGSIRRPMRLADASLIDDRKISVGELDFTSLEIIFLELALRAKRKIFAIGSLKIRELDQFKFGIRITHGAAGRR